MNPNKANAAQKWFEAGLEKANEFVTTWRKARGLAFDAGFYFMKARETVKTGDWILFIESNSARMRPRTVQFYIQLSEAAIGWVKTEQPALPDSKVPAAAREGMMMSPKPLVALLRDLREMRPFGEYDEVRYAQRKLGGGQLELNFLKIVSWADLLGKLDVGTQFTDLPAGKTKCEALHDLADKLRSALERVDSMSQEARDV